MRKPVSTGPPSCDSFRLMAVSETALRSISRGTSPGTMALREGAPRAFNAAFMKPPT